MPLPNLVEFEKKFNEQVQRALTPAQIEEVQKEFLGRKGKINSILDTIESIPVSERKKVGKEVNALKEKIAESIARRKAEIEKKVLSDSLAREKPDTTLPSFPVINGKIHPLTQVLEEIEEIFAGMGFGVAEGPEIETDENNFTALNVPEDHPARNMQDTFYIDSKSKLLLRTQTSPVQIRVMRSQPPPVRMIAPGKVYRHDALDATHSSVFHQVEGLVVDQSISFADLKGTLELFNRQFFGENVKSRFRPSYFPFVEPGAEVDISCTICGTGNQAESSCPVCKGTGWIEILGAGMVHPNVFKAVGYNPEEVTGFAFGMGIERIALVRSGVNDMRLFYENHLDFLNQF